MANSNKTAIADTEAYKEFEAKHNRHLNMLSDSDRNIRRQALNEFKKAVKERNLEILDFFYREKLCKRLVICLEDKVEKNREISIELLTTCIEKCGIKEESQILLPAVANRMIKTPYAEPSEEVRVQLIELLDLCLEQNKNVFTENLGKICQMLGSACKDMNPEMKNICAGFAGRLALALEKKVGSYMKPVVESLIGNLAHQHSKVRKQTLRGLKDVGVCKGAEPYLEGNALHQLKFTQNDRSQDVRNEFYGVLFHWMTQMEIHFLRQYEHELVQFLLNGISDDKLDIGPKCVAFIEDHGIRMKQALIALGEEDEEQEVPEEVKPTQIQSDDAPMIEEKVTKEVQSNVAMDEID